MFKEMTHDELMVVDGGGRTGSYSTSNRPPSFSDSNDSYDVSFEAGASAPSLIPSLTVGADDSDPSHVTYSFPAIVGSINIDVSCQ